MHKITDCFGEFSEQANLLKYKDITQLLNALNITYNEYRYAIDDHENYASIEANCETEKWIRELGKLDNIFIYTETITDHDDDSYTYVCKLGIRYVDRSKYYIGYASTELIYKERI